MPIAIGGVKATYQIKLFDGTGTNQQKVVGDWVSLDAARIVNGVGVAVITIPGYYSRDIVERWMGMVTIERAIGNSSLSLLWEQLYFRVDFDYTFRGKERLWVIYCVDANIILEKMNVDYPPGDPKSEQMDMADDMMKAVVRQNRGSLADGTTDTTRDISSILSVQANIGAAPTTRRPFPQQQALPLFKSLAEESLNAGTYLAFDVVCTTPPINGAPPALQFRTYTVQRNQNHRNPGGNPPLNIGPDFGNLDNGARRYRGRQAASRVIVGGPGNGASKPFRRANNAALQALSPLGLWEAYRDQTDTREISSDAILDARAQAALNAMRPKISVDGELKQTKNLLLGKDINFGDFVTVQVDGQGFDAHLDAVNLTAERKKIEVPKIVLRSEIAA